MFSDLNQNPVTPTLSLPFQFSPSLCSSSYPQTPPSLQTSNTQFIDRLCLHIQQLCLTKTSLQTISQLSHKYTQKVTSQNLPLKTIFTQFFQQIYEFCNQIILRLKKLDNKKFQPLIKRKLTDIFGCVMRYSYDLKVIAVADKMEEMKMLVKVRMSLESLGMMVEGHGNVKEAFLRVKEECWSKCVREEERRRRKWSEVIWAIGRKLRGKQQSQKRLFLNRWHLNVKIRGMVNQKIVVEKGQELYVRIVDSIGDSAKIHEAVLESLKQFCKIDKIQYYRYSNNMLTNYSQYNESLSSDRNQLSADHHLKFVPQGIIKQSIDSEQMVTESINPSTSRLYIPLKYNSVIGIIVIKYQNEQLDWKEIELLLKYTENMSQILGKVYEIQSKVEYYREVINSSNKVAKTLSKMYLDWNFVEMDYKIFLDSVFKELSMIDVEIGFIDDKSERFYCYPEKEPTDRQCLSLVAHQFKYQSRPFIQIKKDKGEQIIIPLRSNRELTGYMKYTSDKPDCLNINTVETIKSFINTVITKLKNQQSLQKGTSSTRVIQPQTITNVNNIERSRTILTVETFDQIQHIINRTITQFKSKLYGTIVWKYNEYYFVTLNNELKIVRHGDKIFELLNLKNQSFESTHGFASQQSSFIRQFPRFVDNKIFQYQSKNKNITIQQLKFDQFVILVGYFQQSVDCKEITYANSIEPRIPYDDLIEVGKNVSLRAKKGYINQDFNSNVFVLEEQLQLIKVMFGKQQVKQTSLADKGDLLSHGRYLCYENKQMNLKLLQMHSQYDNYQSRITNFKILLDSTKQSQQQKFHDTKRQLLMKQKLIFLNIQVKQNINLNLKKIVRKFEEKKQYQEVKVFKMNQILSNMQWTRIPLIQSFNAFKRQAYLYPVIMNKNKDNAVYLIDKLKFIFMHKVIFKIKNYILLEHHIKTSKATALKNLIKLRTANTNKNIQTVLHLLQSKSKKQKQIRSNAQQSSLISLSLLFRKKQYLNLSQLFISTTHQLHELSESISTIIQQISLVRMISYTSFLSFAESRLSLHLDKLFNNKNIEIKFQILRLKQSEIKTNNKYYCLRSNEKTIVLNFQVKEYIVASIKFLSMSQIVTNQVQRLLFAIKDGLGSIKENIRRKLMLLVRVVGQIERNNLKKGIVSMFDNLMLCYKGDLLKSNHTLIEAQNSLALILQSGDQSNKQNTQIHNKLKDIKHKVIQHNKVIETLKLQNKIKKKTLSAALIQEKDFLKQKTLHNLKSAFTKIKIESSLKSISIQKQIDYKLLKSGFRSLSRFYNVKTNLEIKQSFNKIVNKIFINQ